MDALGIDREEIEKTIREGMKWKEDIEEKWHALSAGIEVVFMKQEDNIIVITAYLNRAESPTL